MQGILHFIQLEGFDNGFNFLHGAAAKHAQRKGSSPTWGTDKQRQCHGTPKCPS
jgi:hypothetical protein